MITPGCPVIPCPQAVCRVEPLWPTQLSELLNWLSLSEPVASAAKQRYRPTVRAAKPQVPEVLNRGCRENLLGAQPRRPSAGRGGLRPQRVAPPPARGPRDLSRAYRAHDPRRRRCGPETTGNRGAARGGRRPSAAVRGPGSRIRKAAQEPTRTRGPGAEAPPHGALPKSIGRRPARPVT